MKKLYNRTEKYKNSLKEYGYLLSHFMIILQFAKQMIVRINHLSEIEEHLFLIVKYQKQKYRCISQKDYDISCN